MTTRLSEKVFETLKFGDVRRLYYIKAACQLLSNAAVVDRSPKTVIHMAEQLWRADVRSGVWEDKGEA